LLKQIFSYSNACLPKVSRIDQNNPTWVRAPNLAGNQINKKLFCFCWLKVSLAKEGFKAKGLWQKERVKASVSLLDLASVYRQKANSILPSSVEQLV